MPSEDEAAFAAVILERLLRHVDVATEEPVTEETLKDRTIEEWAREEVLALFVDPTNAEKGGPLRDKLLQTLTMFDTHCPEDDDRRVAIVGALMRSLSFQPLTPLTGIDEEWVQLDEKSFQNRRHGSIFKRVEEDSVTYWNVDGKIFVDPQGNAYSGPDSTVAIEEFPYTPITEYVKIASVDELTASTEEANEGDENKVLTDETESDTVGE